MVEWTGWSLVFVRPGMRCGSGERVVHRVRGGGRGLLVGFSIAPCRALVIASRPATLRRVAEW